MTVMEREISLDTETTGFKPQEGHRLVEIGCVEMINRVATGNNFHVYINPKRDMPIEAFNVHGLSEQFLSDKPLFKDVADDFLKFIGNDKLVIHNADFDIRFLNAELTWVKKREIKPSQVFCTLKYARKKFPGSPATLDALCKRFGIDNSERTLHGALLDAELLAEMYLELMGGSQVSLSLDKSNNASEKSDDVNENITSLLKRISKNEKREPRDFPASDQELEEHHKFVTNQIKSSLWQHDNSK